LAHVVTEVCIKCKHTDCVSVCPTECFHEGPNFLAINPEECIDCGLCVTECPIEAIFDANDLPTQAQHWIEVNSSLAQIWPIIVRKKPAAPDAEKWATVKDKMALLER
jgi:ferredoxin